MAVLEAQNNLGAAGVTDQASTDEKLCCIAASCDETSSAILRKVAETLEPEQLVQNKSVLSESSVRDAEMLYIAVPF